MQRFPKFIGMTSIFKYTYFQSFPVFPSLSAKKDTIGNIMDSPHPIFENDIYNAPHENVCRLVFAIKFCVKPNFRNGVLEKGRDVFFRSSQRWFVKLKPIQFNPFVTF